MGYDHPQITNPLEVIRSLCANIKYARADGNNSRVWIAFTFWVKVGQKQFEKRRQSDVCVIAPCRRPEAHDPLGTQHPSEASVYVSSDGRETGLTRPSVFVWNVGNGPCIDGVHLQ